MGHREAAREGRRRPVSLHAAYRRPRPTEGESLKTYAAHQRHAHRVHPRIRIGILTASDSRTLDTDESGALIDQRLSRRHEVVGRDVVPDHPLRLRQAATRQLNLGADVLIVNGGTGLGPRDVTVEAFQPWFRKEMQGFGERFRAESVAQVGSGAWLSRATAATIHRGGRTALLFLLPGSPDACRLAVEKLIEPELEHAVTLLRGVKPHA